MVEREAGGLEISVIVPCRGHGRELRGLLASLAGQTLARDRFEVIVVDDGSEPALAAAELAMHGELTLRLFAQRAAGPAAARNTAIRQARGRLFVFVNADAVLPSDALARHLAAHAAGGTRAALGRFDFLDAWQTPFLHLAEQLGTLFPYAQIAPGVPLPFCYFWTGNLSVPAEAVRAVGGFEERFTRAVFEDVELGLRLAKQGVPLVFDPSIGGGHDHPFTLASWLERAERFGHEWVLFARLHGGRTFPILDGTDEPDERLRRDLFAGLLHQHDAHAERIAFIERLVTETDAALARGVPRAEVDAEFCARGAEPLTAIHTIARMQGILGAMLGVTPEALATYRARLRPFAVVHSLLEAWDLDDTTRILETLPPGAQLVVTHRQWLAPGALPADPRLVSVRVDAAAANDPWRPILAASAAQTFVFIEGRPLPATSELQALVRFLEVSPAIGAIGLGERSGRAHASAAVVETLRSHATAMTRDVLAADRGAQGDLIARLKARGLLLALLFPPGAPAG